MHSCSPVLPHQLVRVNTIFEVVHEKIGATAWSGASFTTTDLLRGPSGQGIDCVCPAASDQDRIASVLHLIDGQGCDGSTPTKVPILFGLSYSGFVSASDNAFTALDNALSKIVARLKTDKVYDSTWIVIAAPSGSDIAPRLNAADLTTAIKPAIPVRIFVGNLALIWLADPSATRQALNLLEAKSAALGIGDIYSGERLALALNAPSHDPRMPDIIVDPVRSGLSDRATHVALLISGAQLTGRSDPTLVPTTQLGPLLLRALGMEKFDLQALHMEHSPALPGIF